VRAALALTALALMASVQPVRAQQPVAIDATVPTSGSPPWPWVLGERLEYQVKWSFLNVGRARLEVLGIDTVRGEPCWHVQFVFHGSVLGYSLDDSLQSWFGVHDLVSRRFHQDNDENGRKHARHYEIFADRHTWIRNDADSGRSVNEPLDEASFFFYARTRALDPGENIVLHRYFQREHNPVTIQVIQRQTINVPAGRFAAIAVRPIFQSGGIFGQGGKALIWFSDDPSHTPLRIRTSLPIGTLDMSLRAKS
jgi:hypothetical protein